MTSTLPEAVTAYFAATEATDIAPFFTSDAIVHDEKHEHQGPDEIRNWRAETQAKYHPKTEIIGVRENGKDAIIVTGRVSGTFPNSPIELDYVITLEDGKIARLSIA